MKVRTALIGAGYWGQRLARVLRQHPGFELVHVVDRVPERAANLAGPHRWSGEPAAAFGDRESEAVLVATPPATHAALAGAALEAGKHCWVEKPLALDLASGERLVHLAARRGRVLFVDETFLYDPLLRALREWIRAGRLGTIHHFSFERCGMGRIRTDSDVWWNSAPHDLSILRFLTDGAELSSLRVERGAYLRPDRADVAVATGCLASGALVHVYLSWLSPARRASVTVLGSEAVAVYEGRFGQRSLRLHRYRVGPPSPGENVSPIVLGEPVEEPPPPFPEPLHAALEAFRACVREGASAPSEGAAVLATLRLLAAADSAGPQNG